MTIVVNDLVARFRADTAEAERGLQQTRTQLAGVAQEAKATGEQIDQLARKFAQSQGGTAAQWATVLQQQHLSASQVAAQLGTAATNAGRVATATQQIVQPTQAAAKAASDMHEGFRLSESSAIRFGASLIGVGLGISLVAGAGRVLHDIVAGTLGAQLQYEQSLVRARGVLGESAAAVLSMSRAQAAAPGLLGSAQEFIAANLAFQPLATRYGLSQRSIFGVTSAAGRVSDVLGLTAEERADLQSRALASVGGSADALAGYTGRLLDPMTVARRLGGVTPAQLQALTPQQLMAAQAEMTALDLNRLALQGGGGRPGLLQVRTEAERALLRAQGNIQAGLEGTGGTSLIEPMGAELTGRFPGTPYENFRTLQETANDQVRDLQAELEKATKAIGDNEGAFREHTDNLRRMGVEVGSATWRLLGFFGSPENPLSIARGDIGAQAQAALAARGRSAIPAIGTPAAELSFFANQDAYAQAYQNYVARQAQQNTDNAYREFLQGRAESEVSSRRDLPDRAFAAAASNTPAGRAIREAEQTAPIFQRLAQARQTAAQVEFAAAERQAELERITLTQRERGLRMMQETVDLRKLDIQQQQVGLVATQAVIRAQQAAQPVQQRIAAAQFQSDMAVALSQQRMGRLLQGQSVEGLPTVDELIRMNVSGQFATAEAGPEAVARARDIAVAQQPVTAAQLAAALTQTQIRTEELKVDLANLAELPQQTSLELELNQINRDQLSVQREVREYTKQLIWIMTNGNAGGSLAPPAPSDVPGARRGGPY